MAQDNNDMLVEMLKSKDLREKGCTLLLKQYGQALYWHIRRIVVGHEDAEDAMQETTISIITNIDKFKGESNISTWIYKIATNEALKTLRKRCRIMQSIDSLTPDLCAKLSAESDPEAEVIAKTFQQAILTLPMQQRIAFNLRYYNDMPYEEIAKITGKKVNTLKTNYHFAVEKIKKYIKENTL